ncbi:MAG: TSUP family transporter [Acidimicrobiales bacterium]
MLTSVLLFITVFAMAAVSTAVGPGGGVVFAVMAVVLPAPAVVPVHAAIQSGGSLVRLTVLRDFVDRRSLAAFVLGGMIGTVPAAFLIARIELDPAWLGLGLGLATLGPLLIATSRSTPVAGSKAALATLGIWTSFLTVFVGATGSVVGSVLGRYHPRQSERVATHAGCLAYQHFAKIVVYASLGFSFVRFLPLIGGLLTASALGTLVGRRLLVRTSNEVLRAVFDLVTLGLGTFLCVRGGLQLLYRAS